jgi:REG-2-like HAD superfamily hydrolase
MINNLNREVFSRVKGVYFDAGGTLLYPHPSVGEIYALVLSRWGVDRSPKSLQTAFKLSWKRLTHTAKDFTNEESEKQWWRKLVRMTLDGQGVPKDFEGFFEDLYHAFASTEYWRLHDGALDCVLSFRRLGWKTGIISNWDHRLRKILAELPLRDVLDEIIISSEVGCEKPHPEIFHEGARRWSFQPDELLYIGDSLHHDILPARELGWSAWLIHPHEQVPQGIQVVQGFGDIRRILETSVGG